MPDRCRWTLWFVVAYIGSVQFLIADDADIERMIDSLVEIQDEGVGYSPWLAGSEFLPYSDAKSPGAELLGVPPPAASEELKKIVEQGARAVPILLQHLNDKRITKVQPLKVGLLGSLFFLDEYDFNSLTRPKTPQGVNQDPFSDEENDYDSKQHPREHTTTVGDVCYVALGQIVNRNYPAVRYQPSGIFIVSSPTYSTTLRNVILKEWTGLTAEEHKQLLIEDFLHPDSEDRRIGAYFRLSFYYPASVEELVLGELAKPTYDVFITESFCRDTLYKTNDWQGRRRLYEEFIQEHGEIYAQAIQDYLFEDLDILEASEEGHLSPPLTEYSAQPRELLIQFFGKPEDVRSDDRPRVQIAESAELARLIESLTHDDSRKIGAAVQQFFLQSRNDEDYYFASACLHCLANRGFGDFLIEQLDQIDVLTPETNDRHEDYLKALAISTDPVVRQKLFEIVKTTTNDDYFATALPAVDRDQDQLIPQLARKLLERLPEESDQGLGALGIIRDRDPANLKPTLVTFLQPKTTGRIKTVCTLLWNGHPLAPELLSPFLDDERELKGFFERTLVKNEVAATIQNYERSVKESE